ncbi:hypothetical protein OPV22_021296 [Ensete ventricosum]|uniref:Anaphase-promoting complex subunit 4 WD40 domain-containing protein n=1 Tax=Ensete ventricosum TaxID=4639 RepID=A0AAV8QLN0_ENSVE|nr:hypothetical protein OPV22_021296 [Ensete ventricosum]
MQIAQLDLSSTWAFGVRWSPSGRTLAHAGHNSMIYFIENVGSAPSAQNVPLHYSPLPNVVIGIGFDCKPMIFTADETGLWSFVKFLDEKKTVVPSALDMVHSSLKPLASCMNCISCIIPLRKPGDTLVKCSSTSGWKEKWVIWELDNNINIPQLSLPAGKLGYRDCNAIYRSSFTSPEYLTVGAGRCFQSQVRLRMCIMFQFSGASADLTCATAVFNLVFQLNGSVFILAIHLRCSKDRDKIGIRLASQNCCAGLILNFSLCIMIYLSSKN